MTDSETNQAIALEYNGKDAPTVTASGSGDLADEILRLARDNEVPIMENRELLALLSMTQVDQKIPEELYLVVAEIIALAYWMRAIYDAEHADNEQPSSEANLPIE